MTYEQPKDQAMKTLSTLSPVSLRYVAALRGHKPKLNRQGATYTYADAVCAEPEKLICLAASNPEGRFYGFVADDNARRAAEEQTSSRGIFNAIFIAGNPSEILARVANGAAFPPMLDYLCCEAALEAPEKTALFDLAEKRLNPGGLFAFSYDAYSREDGALRFLTRELTPEMTPAQKQEFLTEIKLLTGTYLTSHPDLSAKLDDAIVKGTPESFLSLFDGPASSGSFDMMVAMGPRGLAYAGDARLTQNYVELSVPPAAQGLVVNCRGHILYEQIKDLALNRIRRHDIWVKAPFDMSSVPAELFGGFAYGIAQSRNDVPSAFAAQGKVFDLSTPLYEKLIDLMTVMPIGIGDFLSHADGKDEQPEKILEAIQILVACGIATPMRGMRSALKHGSVAQPRLIGGFNRHLDKTDLSRADVLLASPVMGCGIVVSAHEALVMQALNRAGLANSVSALMPELRRLSQTGEAPDSLGAQSPTPEMAQQMIRDVVEQSLPQWYAYGILEAA